MKTPVLVVDNSRKPNSTPRVESPPELVYAAAYYDPKGNIWYPNLATMDGTTKGAADKTTEIWGSRYKWRKDGMRIMPFRLTFNPAWTETE
jgi:hypothetical protein